MITAVNLANILGVSVEWLTTGEDIHGLKWHKIVNGDLPSAYSTVLDETGDKVDYVGCNMWMKSSDYCSVNVDPPIAWCEVPTFSEEK